MRNKLKGTDIRLSLDRFSKEDGYTVANNTDIPKRIIITQLFTTKKKPIFFSSSSKTLRGDPCYFKLLDRNLRTFQTLKANHDIYLEESRSILMVGIFIPPHSEHVIRSVKLETREVHSPSLEQYFKGNLLLLLPSSYQEQTVIGRATDEYLQVLKKNKHKIDLITIESSWQGRTEINNDLQRASVSYNDIRLLLQIKKYPVIISHWFDEKLAQVLDGSDLYETKIFIHPRPADILLDKYVDFHTKYFEKPQEFPPEYIRHLINERRRVLRKYVEMPNVGWVLDSIDTKQSAEKELGLNFERATVGTIADFLPDIHPNKRTFPVNANLAIVSNFANTRYEGTDIAVRTILDLSSSSFKRRTTFYGNGDAHFLLMSPLASLPDVYSKDHVISWNDLLGIASSTDIIIQSHRGEYDPTGYGKILAEGGSIIVGSSSDNDTLAPKSKESFKELSSMISRLCTDKKFFESAANKAYENSKNAASQRLERRNAIITFYESGQLRPPEYRRGARDAKPLLTVTVPSYNCEKFLMNGILSLINHPLAHKLEILIINDGSKDRTAEVGKKLEQLINSGNRPIVRLIDKENGGHGSTINAGIREATGKYFRLMDGDDYFYTTEFVKLLEILESEDTDIILTNYIEDFAITATKNVPALYDFMEPGLQYDMEHMSYEGYGFWKWGPLLPTNTYKTKLLKEANFMIDENSFYVDMEYNFITYIKAATATYYPLNIYNYYLGRPGQSMSRESLIRNYRHHEKVTLRLLRELRNRKEEISSSKQNYLIHRLIIPMCKMQYMIAIEYVKKPYAFLSFDKELRDFPEFYNNPEIAGRLVKLHRKTRGNSISIDPALKRMKKVVKR